MVEKITITPNHIRGMGNIIDPKTDDDFTVEDCTITEGTDTVNGLSVPVFELEDTFTPPTPTYLIDDDASSDNSSTLFGDSIALRNSGTNSVAWNSSGYYTVTNTKGSSESMRVLSGLNGVTDDFTIEYDAYLQASDGATGLVIYNSSTSFEGLLHDGGTFAYIYNDGSYHETNLSSLSKSQQWVHFKFTVQGTSFTMECSQSDTVLYTTTQTIHLTPSSSTKYGFEVKWTNGRVTRYQNIQAYKI